MKSLGDAIALRNRLIEHLGVETIAAMYDFLREAVAFYPHLGEDLIRVVLVHPGAVILRELDEKLGTYAQKKLAERKVDIRANTKVTAVSDRGVGLSDGTMIKANLLVWTAGATPNPLLETLFCKKGRWVYGVWGKKSRVRRVCKDTELTHEASRRGTMTPHQYMTKNLLKVSGGGGQCSWCRSLKRRRTCWSVSIRVGGLLRERISKATCIHHLDRG